MVTSWLPSAIRSSTPDTVTSWVADQLTSVKVSWVLFTVALSVLLLATSITTVPTGMVFSRTVKEPEPPLSEKLIGFVVLVTVTPAASSSVTVTGTSDTSAGVSAS